MFSVKHFNFQLKIFSKSESESNSLGENVSGAEEAPLPPIHEKEVVTDVGLNNIS